MKKLEEYIIPKEETITEELTYDKVIAQLQEAKENDIPSMIYYKKPMHMQGAFNEENSRCVGCHITEQVCDRVLALPMHPYLKDDEVKKVVEIIKQFIKGE